MLTVWPSARLCLARSFPAAGQLREGDVVQVYLETIGTPEGDFLVSGVQAAVQRRMAAVWKELEERKQRGELVKGEWAWPAAGPPGCRPDRLPALCILQQLTVPFCCRPGGACLEEMPALSSASQQGSHAARQPDTTSMAAAPYAATHVGTDPPLVLLPPSLPQAAS
jgi:hypothetical protein